MIIEQMFLRGETASDGNAGGIIDESPSISSNREIDSSPRQTDLSKKIIIMTGCPGAGKTTTAHRIRFHREDTMVVSRDYFKSPGNWNGCLEKFSNGDAEEVDRKFYAYAKNQIDINSTVVLDATYRERAKRKVAIDFARGHGCRPIIIQCICSYEALVQRLQWQMITGEKKFITSIEGVLDYYIKNTERPTCELKNVSFLQFDTENNRVQAEALEYEDSEYMKQVIKILEQPFDPTLIGQSTPPWLQKIERDGETFEQALERRRKELNLSLCPS